MARVIPDLHVRRCTCQDGAEGRRALLHHVEHRIPDDDCIVALLRTVELSLCHECETNERVRAFKHDKPKTCDANDSSGARRTSTPL
eukprot:288078-Pleurochrysis_carterae.AAC.1